MSPTIFARARADALSRIYTYTLALHPHNSAAAHATKTSSSSIMTKQTQESDALVRSKSERVLQEVKRRHEKAVKEYMGFYKR